MTGRAYFTWSHSLIVLHYWNALFRLLEATSDHTAFSSRPDALAICLFESWGGWRLAHVSADAQSQPAASLEWRRRKKQVNRSRMIDCQEISRTAINVPLPSDLLVASRYFLHLFGAKNGQEINGSPRHWIISILADTEQHARETSSSCNIRHTQWGVSYLAAPGGDLGDVCKTSCCCYFFWNNWRTKAPLRALGDLLQRFVVLAHSPASLLIIDLLLRISRKKATDGCWSKRSRRPRVADVSFCLSVHGQIGPDDGSSIWNVFVASLAFCVYVWW